MNKNEIFDKAKNGVAEIPVSTIIGEYMSLKRTAYIWLAYAPFIMPILTAALERQIQNIVISVLPVGLAAMEWTL